MDWQKEADEARKRLKNVEKEVEALKRRMDAQWEATQELIKKIKKLETDK